LAVARQGTVNGLFRPGPRSTAGDGCTCGAWTRVGAAQVLGEGADVDTLGKRRRGGV